MYIEQIQNMAKDVSKLIHWKNGICYCYTYTQWTRKLSPPLLDVVKVKVFFFCWSNSDIMANTNANIL